jgi:CDP-2,3-bis-(O-geranylgeranyl)-sn-glycerol synthase
MELLLVIPLALWLMIPMLVPNSAAVLFGGGMPMDFGRKMKDGTRILGDGKTWRGLAGGTASGMVIGLIQWGIAKSLDAPDWLWSDGLQNTILILFLLAFGSMLGDTLGSFIKRRMKKKSGAKVPVLDQYDFFIGTMILIVPLQFDWFYTNFIVDEYIIGLIGLIIIIPLLHRAVNIIGYKMGKKDVPW